MATNEPGSTRSSPYRPYAWAAIYAALIAITGAVPLLPYLSGGGFLPLSIPVVALSTAILGFTPGLIAAFAGGLIGSLVSPATYPFGLVDVFFVAVAPALWCGLALRGDQRRIRVTYVALVLLSGIFAHFVPYQVPGTRGGFAAPPEPVYTALVAVFWLPWAALGVFRAPWTAVARSITDGKTSNRAIGLFAGCALGMLPWCLWMIAPWALVAKFSPHLAIANWIFAGSARILLAAITALIGTPLLRALSRSGFPAPAGALWRPKR